MPRLHIRVWSWVCAALAFSVLTASAQTTNTNAFSLPRPAMQDVGSSLVRVMIALTIVIAIFLGIVWLLRNWQRLMIRSGRAPRLNVLEARSLGGRQAIYVVGYDQERFLIGSSTAGIQLLSHLPSADPQSPQETAATPTPGQKMSFAQALSQVLKGGK